MVFVVCDKSHSNSGCIVLVVVVVEYWVTGARFGGHVYLISYTWFAPLVFQNKAVKVSACSWRYAEVGSAHCILYILIL